MKILVLSNGKGEDSIAVTVLLELRKLLFAKKSDGLTLKALPIVGEGNAYRKLGIRVLGAEKPLPSGGFGLQSFAMFWRDIFSGLFGLHLRQIKILKQEKCDLIIAFGDLFCVWLALFSKRPVIHVGTAFSIHLRESWAIERWILLKCKLVITRDEPTAEHLQKYGIKAKYFGNPMMDDPVLQLASLQAGQLASQVKSVICLVPSSRDDAYSNLQRMLDVISKMAGQAEYQFVVSVAPNLDLRKVKELVSPYEKSLSILLSKDDFGVVISSSTIAIGMTGTGCEQVVGLGVPLVLLRGKGPQSSKGRLVHYQKLLGDSVFVPEGTTETIAFQIRELLRDKNRLQKMALVGQHRMGLPGGAKKIAEAILV